MTFNLNFFLWRLFWTCLTWWLTVVFFIRSGAKVLRSLCVTSLEVVVELSGIIFAFWLKDWGIDPLSAFAVMAFSWWCSGNPMLVQKLAIWGVCREPRISYFPLFIPNILTLLSLDCYPLMAFFLSFIMNWTSSIHYVDFLRFCNLLLDVSTDVPFDLLFCGKSLWTGVGRRSRFDPLHDETFLYVIHVSIN